MQEPLPTPPPQADTARPWVPWGIKDLVLCTAVVLAALFLITSAIIGPFAAAYGDEAPETLAASSIANLLWNVAMIAAVLWFVRRNGGNLRDLGFRLPEREGALQYVIGFVFLTFVSLYALVVAYGLIIEALGLDFLEPAQQVPDEFYDSDVALAVLGVAIVGGAPLAEETFFRGFVFTGARRYIGIVLAALASGLLFSLAHINLGLIIPFTAIGAALALSYQHTRTLFVPIGAHLLFNLVSYSILVFVPDARPE